MRKVPYRVADPRMKPRRTKYEIPGWAGKPEPRRDGAHEHPWHCIPFTEGSQYGIEVFYPYDNELRVSRKNGEVQFDCDWGPPPEPGLSWPPFRSFGENFYTYQILIDVKVSEDLAVLTAPHPRYFTSPNDDVPLAVPALLRTAWWPMMSFMVFKNPPEGCTHVFRPGEPFMQMMIIPAEFPFELVEMGYEEGAEREMRGRRIHASREKLAKDSTWLSSTNTVFDGTYRFLHRAAKEKLLKNKGRLEK